MTALNKTHIAVTGFMILALMLVGHSFVLADDYEPADEEDNSTNTFILDADDTGGDVTLQFGETLAEFLRWNSGNASFDLSDETLTLDASNAGGGVNIDLIANQGTDNDGTLRYDATDNRWKISNDGGSFEDLDLASVFYTYDSTGAQVITGTEVTLNFDSVTETITDDDYTFNDGADTVEFNEDGTYQIRVQVGVDDTNTSGGARATNEITIQEDPLGVGSFADIPGAITQCYHRETTENNCSLEIIRTFTATDEIRVRMDRVTGSTNMETQPGNSSILIERIR